MLLLCVLHALLNGTWATVSFDQRYAQQGRIHLEFKRIFITSSRKRKGRIRAFRIEDRRSREDRHHFVQYLHENQSTSVHIAFPYHHL